MARSDPRRVASLDFCAADHGGVEVVLGVHGESPLIAGLTPSRLAERAEVVRRLALRAQDDDRSSFWATGDATADDALLAVEALRALVCRWDMTHVVGPLLTSLGSEPTMVLVDGRGGLPEFSLRQTLRWGVASRRIAPAAAARIVPVPVWAGQGADLLLDQVDTGALPGVRPEQLVFAIQRPPGGAETLLLALLRRFGDPEVCAERLRDLLEAPEDSPHHRLVATALRQWDWTEALLVELRARATALGAIVLDTIASSQLIDLFAGATPDATLVLVAHQDARGVHLADGPVPLPALAAVLARLRRIGHAVWGSVDLGVCHANAPLNLADIVQSAGVPVVMTSGTWAHCARMLGCWSHALDVLAAAETPPSLPRLLDAAWWAQCRSSTGL
ncbi:hypothetical protein OV203_20375 [Nannocystis sp. ILAH1]|uniref:hypothetical protein n=1 Tax=Nannocystis sp. ILAH1 TaxID=2996789 RepID=UPI002270BA38|nr:hypothetical protein [Nannocystis sp. ILAH1]MCY0989508.1 hypothetical protein [Nannocystis sp. ILAH1]